MRSGVLAVVLPSELLQFEREVVEAHGSTPSGEYLNFHRARKLTRRGAANLYASSSYMFLDLPR